MIRSRPATVAKVAATAIAVTLLLAGCSAAASGSADPKSSVTVAIPDEILTLDPFLSQVLTVNRSVFGALTDTDATGALVGQVATDWTANADSTQWVYTIRDGATFSDGTPVTADDVVWTYQQTASRADAINKSYLSVMTSVEKTGDDQVTFTLKAPNAAWPRTTTLISIVPQAAYEADPSSFADAPIGSGPYAVTGFTSGTEVDLEANADYYGDAPAYAEASIQTIADPAARLNALQTSEIDASLVDPSQVDQAKSAGLSVETTSSNGVAYLGFNVTVPGLDNEKLRQAVSYAIDRDSITKTLLGGLAEPIGQLVAPVTAGYDDSVAVPEFDLAKAKTLVADSGYSGEAIDFEYPTDGWIPQASEVAQAIQGYLSDAGITVNMVAKENQALTDDWLGNAMTGIYMFGFKPSTLDSEIVLGLLYGEGSKGYATDPTIDDLITQERAESDPDARAAIIGQIWNTSNDAGYYAALFNDTYSYATVPEVSIDARSDGYVLPYDLKPAS